MKRIFLMRIIAGMLSVLMLFGLGGCKKQPPISGGRVDETDPDAPKVIESKEITDFSVDFCLLGEWSQGNSNRVYHFTVAKNESGEIVLTETELNKSVPADAELFAKIQEIIDKYGLTANNGVYRYTAGIAPEYQKCSLKAVYASGEELKFTMPNEPEAEWAVEMYMTFANLFLASGDASMQPSDFTLEQFGMK